MAEIILRTGCVALLDDEDLPLAAGHRWSQMGKEGYVIRFKGMTRNKTQSTIRLHRLVVRAGPRDVVEFINGNRLDCRRANLRLKAACNFFPRPFLSREVIALTKGLTTRIDEADFERLSKWKWSAVRGGGSRSHYAVRYEIAGGRRRVIFMHREILGAPDDLFVDHANRDTLDNRRENIRLCTATQNACNSYRRPSQTGFRGVRPPHRGYRYKAQIRLNRQLTTIGWFDTAEEAALAYDNAAKLHHGLFASLNFPELEAA